MQTYFQQYVVEDVLDLVPNEVTLILSSGRGSGYSLLNNLTKLSTNGTEFTYLQ